MRMSSLTGLVGVLFTCALAVVSGAGCSRVVKATEIEHVPHPGYADVAPEAARSPEIIGFSHQGRPLVVEMFGCGPVRVYIIGGIHGDETEGRTDLHELRMALAESPLTGELTVRILHDMNPDGTAMKTRGNAADVDLNRNWPARNFRPARNNETGLSPLSEVETAAAHADITKFDPALILVMHSIRSGPFVNFDGPASEPAAVFAGSAGWRVVPDMGYATPGSMGSYFGRDLGVPILTLEYKRGDESGRVLVQGLNAMAVGNRLQARHKADGPRNVDEVGN